MRFLNKYRVVRCRADRSDASRHRHSKGITQQHSADPECRQTEDGEAREHRTKYRTDTTQHGTREAREHGHDTGPHRIPQVSASWMMAPPAKSLPSTIPPPPPSAPPPPSVSQASGSPGRLATKNVTIIEFPQPSRLAPLTAIDANVPAAGVLQPDGSNECNNNLTTDCLRVYNKRQYNTKFKTIDPFTFALWKLSVHLGIHMYLLTLSGSSFHVLVQQHISHAVASLSLFLSCHFAPPPQSPPEQTDGKLQSWHIVFGKCRERS